MFYKNVVFSLLSVLVLSFYITVVCKKDFYIKNIEGVILPAPPMLGSSLFQFDKEIYLENRNGIKDISRWMMAIDDASYRHFDKRMSEALSIQITKTKTPQLYRLLRIIQKSSLRVVDKYKAVYKRPRPYVYYGGSDCVSNKNDDNTSWSYPSGHATYSWAAYLIFSELSPDHERRILQQVREYGDSRVICGAHWQSDIDAGEKLGRALYVALKEHPEFAEIMLDARTELLAEDNKKS